MQEEKCEESEQWKGNSSDTFGSSCFSKIYDTPWTISNLLLHQCEPKPLPSHQVNSLARWLQLKAILREKKEKWNRRTILPLSGLFPSLQAYPKEDLWHCTYSSCMSVCLHSFVWACAEQWVWSANTGLQEQGQSGAGQSLGAAESLYKGILLPSGENWAFVTEKKE